MKILVIDADADGILDWILRCQDAGHQVRYYLRQDRTTEYVGKGLVTFVREWQPSMYWADLVVLPGNTKYLKQLEPYRREGGRVIGATPASADWELNRTEGQRVFEEHGIPVPAYKEFSNYDAAIAYVKKQDRPFVSKPCGDEPDKALTYVAKTPEGLVYMLQRWKKAQKLKGKFILQELVNGAEMAVGGWFGPGGFNQGWHQNWEFKKLAVGDMGPATGEMGTVWRVVKQCKLADKVLKPLAASLEKLGHTGYVDVNCIIDDKGQPWPLEFTMRKGWPSFNIQQALNKGDPAEWLLDLAEGRDAKNWVMDDVAVGVVMAIPDFPYSHITRKDVVDIPIYGLRPDLLPHIHPTGIKLGTAPQKIAGKIVDAPCWVTAGDYVLIATGVGDSVTKAREKVYRVLDNLKDTPNNPFWRTDIGRRLAKQLPRLQANGYAAGLVY